jgi:hypothetical protein
VAQAWKHAEAWPKENHVILAVFSLFSIFVFLNLLLALYLVPQMLKEFLGIDTVFTLSGWALLNTTFLFTVCGLTYLAIDPLLKTIYVLRVFYAESLSTGADLQAELRKWEEEPISKQAPPSGLARKLGAAAIFVLAFFCSQPGAGGEAPSAGRPVSAGQLDRSIEEVLQRREYAWRMPRAKGENEDEERGLLGRFFDAVFAWVRELLRAVRRFFEWLADKLTPELEPGADPALASGARLLRLLVYGLLACAAAAILVALWRWRHRPAATVAGMVVAAAAVSPLEEDVAPQELPDEKWLAMAAEYAGHGDFRSALRAVYLAMLANLGQRELIVLVRSKSNTEYLRELRRRAHPREDLPEAFAASVAVYERTWYGRHPATEEMLASLQGSFKRLSV